MSQQESKRPHSQESMQWRHQPCIKSKPITTDFCMWRDQQSGGAGRIHKVCQTNAQPPKHHNWRKLHCLSQVHRHIQQVPPVLDLEVSLVEELQDGHCGIRQPAQHAQRDSEQLLQHPMTCLYPPPATPTAASVTPMMELWAMCSAHCASSRAQPAEQQANHCLLSGTFQIMLHRAAGPHQSG